MDYFFTDCLSCGDLFPNSIHYKCPSCGSKSVYVNPLVENINDDYLDDDFSYDEESIKLDEVEYE